MIVRMLAAVLLLVEAAKIPLQRVPAGAIAARKLH